MKPTLVQSNVFQQLFDYNNRVLFGAALPACILSFARSGRNSVGWFKHHEWCKIDGNERHEIALNPDILQWDPLQYTSVLVRLMAELWQHLYGVPSRKGYCNRELVDKLHSLGIASSVIGDQGGRQTGQTMRYEVLPDGLFRTAFEAMPAKYYLPFRTAGHQPARTNSMISYRCDTCRKTIWAKPGMEVLGGCAHQLLAPGAEEDPELLRRILKLLLQRVGLERAEMIFDELTISTACENIDLHECSTGSAGMTEET